MYRIPEQIRHLYKVDLLEAIKGYLVFLLVKL
jgi:hypothetical protein